MGTIIESPVLNVRLVRKGRGATGRGGPVLGQVEEYFLETMKHGDTFMFGGRVLRFESALRLQESMRRAGMSVTLVPFDGGHEIPASVVAALVPLGPGLVDGGESLLDPDLLAVGAVVALMSSVIPYSLEVEALRRIPASVFGVLMSLEPAIAALAGFLVLGQDLGARELLAMSLVVVASVGVTRAASGPPPVEDQAAPIRH